MPKDEPINKQIINTQPESDSDAVAVKKELILQPPAIQAPYPINRPPVTDKNNCFMERIFCSLNFLLIKADVKAPNNNPRFLRIGAIAFAKVSA